MISDDQFEACRLAANESYKRHKYSIRGQIVTPEDDWEWHFAQAIFKLAQEVKPLDFVRIDTTTKKADTAFGPYFICDYIDEVRMALPEETNYFGRGYKTEEEAIEAANIDNRRRVLGCLVNGGV